MATISTLAALMLTPAEPILATMAALKSSSKAARVSAASIAVIGISNVADAYSSEAVRAQQGACGRVSAGSDGVLSDKSVHRGGQDSAPGVAMPSTR